jgi:hypothetical protein
METYSAIAAEWDLWHVIFQQLRRCAEGGHELAQYVYNRVCEEAGGEQERVGLIALLFRGDMNFFRQFDAEARRLERLDMCDAARSVLCAVYHTISEGTVQWHTEDAASTDDADLSVAAMSWASSAHDPFSVGSGCLKVCVEFTGLFTAKATVDIPIDLNMSAYKAHLELLYNAFVALKIPPDALTDEYTDDVDLTCSPQDLPMLYGHHVLLVEVFERRGQDPSLLEGSARRREVLAPSRTVDLILHDMSTRKTVSLETHTNSDMSAVALRLKESLHPATRPLSILTVGTGRTGPLLPKTGSVRDALVAGSELQRPFANITSFYALVGGGKRGRSSSGSRDDVQRAGVEEGSTAPASASAAAVMGEYSGPNMRKELLAFRSYVEDLCGDPNCSLVYAWSKLQSAASSGSSKAKYWCQAIQKMAGGDELGRIKVFHSLLNDDNGDRSEIRASSSAAAAVAPAAASSAPAESGRTEQQADGTNATPPPPPRAA